MPQALWSRTAVIIAALLAGIVLTAWLAPSPRIMRHEPPRPRLVRVGAGELAVTAEAALIRRLATGETLYEQNAEERLPIASLTKLMTALVLVEEARPLEEIEFSEAAKRIGEADDKRSAARPGERFRAEDALRMLLISSDNDAAYAAAEHVAILRQPELSGKAFEERIGPFVELMNDRAVELGLLHTRFSNPAGSDDADNYSSASDLARLAAFIAHERPELWAISRVQETFVFSASGRRLGLVNTNPLLAEFPAIYGSKTGFEDAARGALLVIYQLARDEEITVVLLRSADRFADGRAALRWLDETFVIESP